MTATDLKAEILRSRDEWRGGRITSREYRERAAATWSAALSRGLDAELADALARIDEAIRRGP